MPFPKADNYNGGNAHVKTIANPRRIASVRNCHGMNYFEGLYAINEAGNFVKLAFNNPVTADKIVLHHYASKSAEEFSRKLTTPLAYTGTPKNPQKFHDYDRNEEFDDSILAYRDAKAKIYQPPKPRSTDDLIKALEKNLPSDAPSDFYAGKMETFLTCRALSNYLDDKSFEEAALKAISKTLETSLSPADKGLLNQELPELLKLTYPVVEQLRKVKI